MKKGRFLKISDPISRHLAFGGAALGARDGAPVVMAKQIRPIAATLRPITPDMAS